MPRDDPDRLRRRLLDVRRDPARQQQLRPPRSRRPLEAAVLCPDPASLSGGSGTLRPYEPSTPFPGVLGADVIAEEGPLPSVSTPWIAQPGGYRAHCSTAGEAHTLQIQPVDGARLLAPEPDPTWGLHLADVNIALGNLTDLVRRETAAYAVSRSAA